MDQETLECNQCNKTFKLKRTLQAHSLIHTGEKPYKCDKCDAQFRQFSSLQKHDRTHTGVKPYQCKDCDAKFSQISNLKRHEKLHTKEKPFTCDSCGKQFITQQNYQQHTTKHLKTRRQFSCESGCDKSYYYMCSLKKHEKETHKKHTFKNKAEEQSNEQKVELDVFFKLDQMSQQNEKLRDFFTCSHPQIFHQNHIDILFNGRLYNYNEENGKIEHHEYNDGTKLECDPVGEHQHFSKKSFGKVDCTSCFDTNGQQVAGTSDCCKSCKDNCNDCCLACNKGLCNEAPFPQSTILHFHGPNCGHPIVIHNGHVDYLVDEMLHYPHGGHCDNHGILNRISVQ